VKKLVPGAEVVILERSGFFLSCPATLEYVFGLNWLDTIACGYWPLIGKGIKVIRTQVVAVKPYAKRVVTGQGAADYDQGDRDPPGLRGQPGAPRGPTT
jgi:hypothetical protein